MLPSTPSSLASPVSSTAEPAAMNEREANNLPPTYEQIQSRQASRRSRAFTSNLLDILNFLFFGLADLIFSAKSLLGLAAGTLCLLGAFLVFRQHEPGELKYVFFAFFFGLAIIAASLSTLRDVIRAHSFAGRRPKTTDIKPANPNRP